MHAGPELHDLFGPTDVDGPVVAVVGGGIAGLAAAWELSGEGAGPVPGAPRPSVVVLEASGTTGGKLVTREVGGRPVDVGPDGFLARRPEAVALCREVGLGDQLVPIGASGAAVWARGRRRALPDGLALGVPTRPWPTVRSGILGPAGSLRLLVDVLSPRPDRRTPIGDRAVGPLIARKLGHRVVDALVDPLVGGIHAGSVADMSAAAVFPALLAAAQRRGSFMRALRRAVAAAVAGQPSDTETDDTPAFWALCDGMGSLVERLVAALGERGVRVCTGVAVGGLARAAEGGPGWVLDTPGGAVHADGVILAAPAPVTARLLEPHDTEAAGLLDGIDHASVTTVTLAFPESALSAELTGTGLLVPHGTAAPPGVEEAAPIGDPRFLVTACTHLSVKWPHLARPGEVLLRASCGRYGDDRAAALSEDALVRRVRAELLALMDVDGDPLTVSTERFPGAFPQYRVHHLPRVTGVEAAVQRLPALAVCGAAYHGVGIPACIGSGRTAALTVLRHLGDRASEAGPRR